MFLSLSLLLRPKRHKIIYDFPKRDFFSIPSWNLNNISPWFGRSFSRFVYFWRMKSHLLNFNEMNFASSSFSFSSFFLKANILEEMCNKQCDQNLVKRERNIFFIWKRRWEESSEGWKSAVHQTHIFTGMNEANHFFIFSSIVWEFFHSFFSPPQTFFFCVVDDRRLALGQ